MSQEFRRNGRQRQQPETTAPPDRLPPHSPEMEQAVLGCCLLQATCIADCIARFGKESDGVFYDVRHQTICKAIMGLFNEGKAVEVITVQQRLKDQQLLEQVGGIVYLASLPDQVTSTLNLPDYLDVVMQKAKLRKMLAACIEGASRIYDDESKDAEDLIESTETAIMAARNIGQAQQAGDIRTSVRRAIEHIEKRWEAAKDPNTPAMPMGLPTGFHDLDKITFGLHPKSFVVIAARPSQGKTSLAMNIAEHVAIDQNLPVGVFSLETDLDSLVMRMLCSRARVNLRNVNDGFLAERDFPKITGAAGKIANANIHIDDASGLTVVELRARARRMKMVHGIKLLVIDYLQLLHALVNGRRPEKREREIAEISTSIKHLAKDIDVPVIVISQLGRGVEKQKRRPMISDLRESGQIEQDADVIGLLYRENSEDDEAEDYEGMPMVLDIAKNRDGAKGKVHLTFLKSFTRFESAAKVSEDDIPPDQGNLPYNS